MNTGIAEMAMDGGGDWRFVSVLLDWAAEIIAALVGSMIGSDFGQCIIGASVGLAVGAVLHAGFDFGYLLKEPRVDQSHDDRSGVPS